ncbi:MAG TPA: DUF6167 family protein [Kineosporiaceae bacterium]
MRRVFWVALGATAGVLIVRKINKIAEAYTPEGVGRSLSSLADALRDVADAVREGMAEREQELRLALGVDAGELDPDTARELLEKPTGPRPPA